jgi:peptidoglycan/xylan/chitin deacetylase (PgdA/CDA1 family)
MSQHRLVVFTGNPSFSVRKGIVEIDRALPGTEWLILIHAPRKTARQLARSQVRNIRRNGWRWIPYQGGDVLNQLVQRFKRPPAAVQGPGSGYTLDALGKRPNLRLMRVADIHGQESLEAVRAFAPDLGLSLAAPILKEKLFAIPRLGTLNLHKGKVPHYRGMPPAFWELWNDEQEVGCTVHWVDAKLDTGDLAAQAVVAREAHATLKGLQLQLDETGVALMRAAVQAALAGQAQRQPQPEGGHTYLKPTLAQVRQLDAKMRGFQPPRPALVPRLVKDSAAALIASVWNAGAHRLRPPRITVLLYHRVSDSARDNLTVGIEQFDRQMALLREHFQVLSIEQVANATTIEHGDKPLACVTFDDGYLDNYTNAAAILLRHQIPAAFYVSTGLIGTEYRFPHDVRRGNDPIPLMDWTQLERMVCDGFTIGSHTVNHIDCAAESDEVVARELAESKAALHSRLGLKEVMLAYPYGGRHHMTPARLEMVKQAGYSACLSAYGGTNIGSVDRFNVLRKGIHWEFSDRAFLYAALGVN